MFGRELLQVLHLAAQDFARGKAPPEVARWFLVATMIAIRISDGGVRGIATGNVFRRFGGKVFVPTAHRGGREGVCSISICHVHSCRHRVCGSCCAGDDGFQPTHDSPFDRRHWRIRPRAQERRLEQVARSGELPWSVAFVRSVYSQPSLAGGGRAPTSNSAV